MTYLQFRTLRLIAIGASALSIGSSWAVDAKTDHTAPTTVTELPAAPKHCGIGMECGISDVLLFQCEGDFVTVKKAPWGKTLKTIAETPGTTRRFTRDAFAERLKDSLTEANMSQFNFFKRDTLADLKSKNPAKDISNKTKCSADLKIKIDNFEAALAEYRQIPNFAATKLASLESELATARTGLKTADQDTAVCQAKNDVFNRVRAEMDTVIDSICQTDLKDPKKSWVIDATHNPKIYSLMAGFNFDLCGTSGSLDERIRECGQVTTLTNGAKVDLVSVEANKVRIYRDDSTQNLFSSLVSNCDLLNTAESAGRKNWRPANNATKMSAFKNPAKNQKLAANAQGYYMAENPYFYEAIFQEPLISTDYYRTPINYVMSYFYRTADENATEGAKSNANLGTSSSISPSSSVHCVSTP